jgi:Taurine catabolism dioxygenase TauD, TfdA family
MIDTNRSARLDNEGNEPFLRQAEEFKRYFTRKYSLNHPLGPVDLPTMDVRPLEPVIVDDVMELSRAERQAIHDQYYSQYGIATFVAKRTPGRDDQPLLALTEQLKDDIDLYYPITHPKETNGIRGGMLRPTGGVRIYDDRSGQVFATSNNNDFVLHQDGLGSAGSVRTVILYMECPPLVGGYSYFQNLVHVALNLASTDEEAYRKLFLPDAITITRPTGSRALQVTGPVLYIDDEGHARVNFVGVSPAHPVGDYEVRWSSDADARRGLEYLLLHSRPFAPRSVFCHLSRAASGIIFDNTCLVHGRTAFVDATEVGGQRVVWRKWFASNQRNSGYRHAPGLRLAPELSSLRPDLFGDELLDGEWRYSESGGTNVRFK